MGIEHFSHLENPLQQTVPRLCFIHVIDFAVL
jgi:hypothetical protein